MNYILINKQKEQESHVPALVSFQLFLFMRDNSKEIAKKIPYSPRVDHSQIVLNFYDKFNNISLYVAFSLISFILIVYKTKKSKTGRDLALNKIIKNI